MPLILRKTKKRKKLQGMHKEFSEISLSLNRGKKHSKNHKQKMQLLGQTKGLKMLLLQLNQGLQSIIYRLQTGHHNHTLIPSPQNQKQLGLLISNPDPNYS